jgi:hypothetical protein
MSILILLPTNQYIDLDEYIKLYNIKKIILLEEEYLFQLQHEFKHIFLLETFHNYFKLLKEKYTSKLLKINYVKTITVTHKLYMFNPLNYILIEKYKKYNIEYINKLPNYLFSYEELKLFYENNIDKKLILVKNFINYFSEKQYNNEIKDDMKISNKEIQVNQLKYKLIGLKHNYKYTHKYSLDYSYVPLTHKDAEIFLNHFIKNKLKNYFSSYLLINKNSFINNHSGFSALLNIGLLTPNQIMNKIKDPVFIRQLYIREYYNYIYLFYYYKIIKENYWNLNLEWNKNLKYNLYNANTQVEIFDNEFNKAIYIGGYTHHIVRLKVFLAYLLMIKLHPLSIVQWFKENISIDAYDNFMYSIIYGISQSNEYPKFINKIYLTTDNYFINISNYKNKNNILTFLYYNFLNEHKEKLKKTLYKRHLKNIKVEYTEFYKKYLNSLTN